MIVFMSQRVFIDSHFDGTINLRKRQGIYSTRIAAGGDPLPSFPRKRESRVFKILLDARSLLSTCWDKFHGHDESVGHRRLFQQPAWAQLRSLTSSTAGPALSHERSCSCRQGGGPFFPAPRQQRRWHCLQDRLSRRRLQGGSASLPRSQKHAKRWRSRTN